MNFVKMSYQAQLKNGPPAAVPGVMNHLWSGKRNPFASNRTHYLTFQDLFQVLLLLFSSGPLIG